VPTVLLVFDRQAPIRVFPIEANGTSQLVGYGPRGPEVRTPLSAIQAGR
jgi:hypothetical protein